MLGASGGQCDGLRMPGEETLSACVESILRRVG